MLLVLSCLRRLNTEPQSLNATMARGSRHSSTHIFPHLQARAPRLSVVTAAPTLQRVVIQEGTCMVVSWFWPPPNGAPMILQVEPLSASTHRVQSLGLSVIRLLLSELRSRASTPNLLHGSAGSQIDERKPVPHLCFGGRTVGCVAIAQPKFFVPEGGHVLPRQYNQ